MRINHDELIEDLKKEAERVNMYQVPNDAWEQITRNTRPYKKNKMTKYGVAVALVVCVFTVKTQLLTDSNQNSELVLVNKQHDLLAREYKSIATIDNELKLLEINQQRNFQTNSKEQLKQSKARDLLIKSLISTHINDDIFI